MTCNGPATSSEGYHAGLLWERMIWNTSSSTFGQLMSIATHWKGKGFSCSVLRCWLHSRLKDQEQSWRVALEESEGLAKLCSTRTSSSSNGATLSRGVQSLASASEQIFISRRVYVTRASRNPPECMGFRCIITDSLIGRYTRCTKTPMIISACVL